MVSVLVLVLVSVVLAELLEKGGNVTPHRVHTAPQSGSTRRLGESRRRKWLGLGVEHQRLAPKIEIGARTTMGIGVKKGGKGR